MPLLRDPGSLSPSFGPRYSEKTLSRNQAEASSDVQPPEPGEVSVCCLEAPVCGALSLSQPSDGHMQSSPPQPLPEFLNIVSSRIPEHVPLSEFLNTLHLPEGTRKHNSSSTLCVWKTRTSLWASVAACPHGQLAM